MDNTWIHALPATMQALFLTIPPNQMAQLEEIRIRENRSFELGFRVGFTVLDYVPTRADCKFILEMLTEHSLYSFETQLQQGFITLAGGHRVGIVGRTTLEQNRVRHVHDVAGFNIRIARAIIGCARPFVPGLLDVENQTIHNTLIIAPPQQGKTTLLRDMARIIGDGAWPDIAGELWPAQKVGIVDERSEIAACVRGVPRFQVGLRTDVLDNCPKATGMMMLIRAMSPQVIIVDEIGRDDDAHAIHEAALAGIRIVASAHGHSLSDIRRRPMFRALLDSGVFQRYIVIGHRYASGTLVKAYDALGKELEHRILPFQSNQPC